MYFWQASLLSPQYHSFFFFFNRIHGTVDKEGAVYLDFSRPDSLLSKPRKDGGC